MTKQILNNVSQKVFTKPPKNLECLDFQMWPSPQSTLQCHQQNLHSIRESAGRTPLMVACMGITGLQQFRAIPNLRPKLDLLNHQEEIFAWRQSVSTFNLKDEISPRLQLAIPPS